MAASGSTPLSLYYSATASNVPLAANLVAGELAINTNDGKLFYKDSAGVVQVIAGKGGAGVAGGSNTQVQYNSSGSLAGSANMVFDGSTLTTLNTAYTGTLTGGTGVIAIGTNQIYKTSAGIVGIGTATPATFSAYANLAVLNGIVSSSSATDGGVYIGSTTAGTEIAYLSMGRSYNLAASGDTVLSTSASKPLIFGTNNAERMRIDSSGNVGIGTSSPAYKLDVQKTASAQFRLFSTNNSTGSQLILGSGTGTGTTSQYVYFDNSLVFSAASVADRMIINSSGIVLINTTSAVVNNKESLGVIALDSTGPAGSFKNSAGASSATIECWNSATTGNNVFNTFSTDGYVVRGSVTYNRAGGLTVYNTTSDYRAKDIFGHLLDSGEVIDSVPVYMGKMKGATQARPMFIAHETPDYAHTGEKDAVDKNGNPVFQQMDASSLVPVLWAEVQSLRKRLALLESK